MTPNLQKAVADAAKIMSGVYKANGNLLAERVIIGPALELNQILKAAIAELPSVTPQVRGQLELTFNANLDLGDDAAKAKIIAGEGYLNRGLDLALQALQLSVDVKAYLGV